MNRTRQGPTHCCPTTSHPYLHRHHHHPLHPHQRNAMHPPPLRSSLQAPPHLSLMGASFSPISDSHDGEETVLCFLMALLIVPRTSTCMRFSFVMLDPCTSFDTIYISLHFAPHQSRSWLGFSHRGRVAGDRKIKFAWPTRAYA